MARSPEDLRRLARELAASALTPEERARVLAEAAPRDRLRPPSFTPPLLAGGTRWIGGTSGARTCTATMAAAPVFIDTNVLDATVTPMTVRDLQLSYFAADTPETWVDRMEA